jgi:transposase
MVGDFGVSLRVRHPDFAHHEAKYNRAPGALNVRLSYGGTIEGRVVDAVTGKPAANVDIVLRSMEDEKGDNLRQTKTNDQGIYRITLGPARYCVWAVIEDRTCVALDSVEAVERQTRQWPELRLIEGGWIVGRIVGPGVGEHRPHRQERPGAEALGAGHRSVQEWVQRYNENGVEGLEHRPGQGRPWKLSAQDKERLCARIEAGPREEDSVCTLRGKDIQRILKKEFGKLYHLNGVYSLLHRLGYSSLVPRPRHRHADPEAQEAFKKNSLHGWRRSAPPIPTKPSKSGAKTKRDSVNKAR